jgi:hypothetical protein
MLQLYSASQNIDINIFKKQVILPFRILINQFIDFLGQQKIKAKEGQTYTNSENDEEEYSFFHLLKIKRNIRSYSIMYYLAYIKDLS